MGRNLQRSVFFKLPIVLGLYCMWCVQESAAAEVVLFASVSNGSVNIAWPTQYVGYYYLQETQDPSGPWSVVRDSFATNRMVFLNNSSGGRSSAFYRLAAVATADPSIGRNGLIAEYLLNGTPVDSGMQKDQGHNGSVQGGVLLTTNRFGEKNAAFQFNGIDGFVQVQDDAAFSISTTREFSISAWMRPDTDTFPKADGTAPGHWVYWLSKLEYGNHCDSVSGSQDEWGFRMYNRDSGETEPSAGTCGVGSVAGRPNWVSIYVFNLCAPSGSNFGAGSRTQCSPAIIGKWTHYVATFRYTGLGTTNGLIELYKDGFKIDHDAFLYQGNAINPSNGSAPVRFGKGSGDYFFQGAIDNVRFYNRAVSPQEVLSLFHDQTP